MDSNDVEQYLAETPFIPSPEDQPAQIARNPMIYKGKIAICSGDLLMHINKTMLQHLTVKDVTSMLSAVGGKNDRVRGKFKEQSRWLLPVEEFDPADYCAREREPGDDDE